MKKASSRINSQVKKTFLTRSYQNDSSLKLLRKQPIKKSSVFSLNFFCWTILGTIFLTALSVFCSQLSIQQVICEVNDQPCPQVWQDKLDSIFLNKKMFFHNLSADIVFDQDLNKQISEFKTQKKFPQTVAINLQLAPVSYYLHTNEQFYEVNQLKKVSILATNEINPATPIVELNNNLLEEKLQQTGRVDDFYLSLWQKIFDLAQDDNIDVTKLIFDEEENLIADFKNGQEIWFDPTDVQTSWQRFIYLRNYWSDYSEAQKIDVRFNSPVAVLSKNTPHAGNYQVSVIHTDHD